MAWIDEIKARIGLYVGSQGNQAGLSGLAELLNDIADKANEGGGGSELITLHFTGNLPVEHTGTREEVAEAVGITPEQLDKLMKGEVAAVAVIYEWRQGMHINPLQWARIPIPDDPQSADQYKAIYGFGVPDEMNYTVGIQVYPSEDDDTVLEYFVELVAML